MNSKQKSIMALFPKWNNRLKIDSLQMPGSESAVHQLFSDLCECYLGDPLLRDDRMALISVNPEFTKLRIAAEFFDAGLYATLMFVLSRRVRKVYQAYARLAALWLDRQMEDVLDFDSSDVDWTTILDWVLTTSKRLSDFQSRIKL